MKRHRLLIGLLVPALLVGLVVLLATLQYQWLGKVSEAEREQLRRSLSQRAREFADDFDQEISRAFVACQLAPDELAARDWTAFANAVDRWRATSRYPAMARAIYLAEPSGDTFTLRRYDVERREFEATALGAWPANLEPVRTEARRELRVAAPPSPGQTQVVALASIPVLPDVPALIVPVSPRNPPGPVSPAPAASPGSIAVAVATGAARWPQSRGPFVLVEFDGDYVRKTVVPALAARHFPEQGEAPYRVAVRSGRGATVFARGLEGGASLDPDSADVAMPFFSLRFNILTAEGSGAPRMFAFSASTSPGSSMAGSPPSSGQRVSVVMEQVSGGAYQGGGPPSTTRREIRLPLPGWQLLLQHSAGSLDAAVGQARRRNLWLSFGILSILAAGVVLVVINARRSEQLAARQMDFVATVSHELRTPLAVIRSAGQNLAAGVVSDPAQAKRYGELVETEGRRLTDMVEQVLEYAGLSGSRRLRGARPVHLPALVDEVLASCRAQIEAAGVTVEVDATGAGHDVPAVVGDEEALRRAFENLVTNALKHGADGRWLGVAVSGASLHRRREVRVTVSDRGRGIAPADLAHLFEPFYRGSHALDRQIRGSGLGLSLVKRIVEAHGGRVTVRSAPGEGAAFTVHLPAAGSLPVDPPADQTLGRGADQAGDRPAGPSDPSAGSPA